MWEIFVYKMVKLDLGHMQISHLGKGRRETLETRLEEQKPWKPGRPGALLLYGMPLEVRDLGESLLFKV